uniref:Arginine/serine-rich coiled-coil protein 2 n=1 Tax=Xenopus tropicalis TaxID=8364 RepID=F6Z7M0_XENTR
MGSSVPLGLTLLLLLHWAQVHANQGILHAIGNQDPSSAKDYCITYNSTWTPLPASYSNATYYELEDLSFLSLCSATEVPQSRLKDKAVVVLIGNCSILAKAAIAQNSGAKLLLVASKEGLPFLADNKSDYKSLTIPIAYIRYRDVKDMKPSLGSSVRVTLYSPALPKFDFSMLLIFLISVFTVALGGYWSGLSELPSPPGTETEGRKKKDDNVTFTPLTVIFFVVICCVMLLLLYFFYKWLVYVIIAVFCLASATSLFNCLSAIIQNIPYGKCRISCCNKSAEVRLFFLAAFCIAVSVTWVVFRNEDRWIWILQDILGIAFCLNFIKTLRMPNFKACVILLGLLLLYDVFFVFITPFITKLPVVIRVPRLEFSANTLCQMSFSLLGFGDIIVPGLLVAYCRRFDVRSTSSMIYYICCTIAYAVGMVLTFIVLTLMKMGQPALLYLVPCTLLTSSVIAWRRKEMKKFWNGGGYEIMEHMDNAVNEEGLTSSEQEEQ